MNEELLLRLMESSKAHFGRAVAWSPSGLICRPMELGMATEHLAKAALLAADPALLLTREAIDKPGPSVETLSWLRGDGGRPTARVFTVGGADSVRRAQSIWTALDGPALIGIVEARNEVAHLGLQTTSFSEFVPPLVSFVKCACTLLVPLNRTRKWFFAESSMVMQDNLPCLGVALVDELDDRLGPGMSGRIGASNREAVVEGDHITVLCPRCSNRTKLKGRRSAVSRAAADPHYSIVGATATNGDTAEVPPDDPDSEYESSRLFAFEFVVEALRCDSCYLELDQPYEFEHVGIPGAYWLRGMSDKEYDIFNDPNYR